MSTKKVLLAAVMCFVLSLCPLLYGQANGSFSGTVADKTGSVIPGASVKITSQGTGLVRDAKSDGSGHYLVPLLPVAFYTIHVEAQGFQTTEQREVRLQVDEQREIDFSLNPASVTQNVEVSATEVAVETTNPTLGQVITSEEVADLPLNGRNFVQLATLTPGTTTSYSPSSFFSSAASSEAATRGSFSLSVGGSREQSTDWLLDGNDNNQLDEGGIGIFPDIDDIQEFKVLSYNYSAEYGERAGPTVLVTTKSGSNQFHGTAFEFFRNTNLDAKTPFVDTATKFNLNQYGGSIGGPIQKDKTFFFLDYQAKVQRKGVPFTGYVPTAGMITQTLAQDGTTPIYDESTNPLGIGTPGNPLINPYPYLVSAGPPIVTATAPFICHTGTNIPVTPALSGPYAGSQGPDTQSGVTDCPIIPGVLVNSIGAAVAQLYPAPTPGIAATAGYNYANQPIRRLNEGTGDIRVDHNLSSHDSIFGRFSYDQATSYIPGGSPTWSAQNAFGTNQSITNHGRNAVISEQHVFSANTINQFTAGFNRIFNHILSYGDFAAPRCEAATLGILGANLDSVCSPITGYPTNLNQASNDCISCGMTSFQMGSYFSIGDRGYAPYQGGTNVYSVGDTVDFVRGRHDIRVGATYRAEEMNVRNNAFQDGYIVNFGGSTHDDIADLLLGTMGAFSAHDQTFLGGTVGRRYKLIRPFVQDDFRVTSNLTLNLGLAWAIVTPETEVRNRQANFDIATLQWYVPAGSPAISGCTNCVTTDGRVGIQMDKTGYEPRIGFAWKPAGRQNLVVRGGYAIYHDSSWDQGGQGLWQNPPYYAEVDPYPLGVCTPFGAPGCGLTNGFLLPAGTPSTVTVDGGAGAIYNAPVNPSNYSGTIQSMNRNFKMGSVQQFNLNVEQELPGNVVFTLGYAGTRSRHILVSQLNENLSSPSACGVVPGYTLGCGFPSFPYAFPFQVVATNNSIGSAQYDSLQAKLETKSVRHGLYALLGYTWSRNFDTGLTDGLGTNPGALYYPLPGTARMDWGLSQLNLNDSFTASVLYDLPFGKGKHFGGDWGSAANAIAGNWHVNVIERATSGFPLFVVDSSDGSGIFFSYNGLTVQRPNQVGNPNVGGPEGGQTNCPAKVHTLQNWFNPCAFESAPAGELGTAARAPVYGPRFVNTDFSIFKDFPMSFREGTNLQFRAEFFNLLNHPQYWLAGISGTGEQDINTQSSFGVITQTLNNPRLIQFALKLQF
jgi:hypothetical protein